MLWDFILYLQSQKIRPSIENQYYLSALHNNKLPFTVNHCFVLGVVLYYSCSILDQAFSSISVCKVIFIALCSGAYPIQHVYYNRIGMELGCKISELAFSLYNFTNLCFAMTWYKMESHMLLFNMQTQRPHTLIFLILWQMPTVKCFFFFFSLLSFQLLKNKKKNTLSGHCQCWNKGFWGSRLMHD